MFLVGIFISIEWVGSVKIDITFRVYTTPFLRITLGTINSKRQAFELRTFYCIGLNASRLFVKIRVRRRTMIKVGVLARVFFVADKGGRGSWHSVWIIMRSSDDWNNYLPTVKLANNGVWSIVVIANINKPSDALVVIPHIAQLRRGHDRYFWIFSIRLEKVFWIICYCLWAGYIITNLYLSWVLEISTRRICQSSPLLGDKFRCAIELYPVVGLNNVFKAL